MSHFSLFLIPQKSAFFVRGGDIFRRGVPKKGAPNIIKISLEINKKLHYIKFYTDPYLRNIYFDIYFIKL